MPLYHYKGLENELVTGHCRLYPIYRLPVPIAPPPDFPEGAFDDDFDDGGIPEPREDDIDFEAEELDVPELVGGRAREGARLFWDAREEERTQLARAIALTGAPSGLFDDRWFLLARAEQLRQAIEDIRHQIDDQQHEIETHLTIHERRQLARDPFGPRPTTGGLRLPMRRPSPPPPPPPPPPSFPSRIETGNEGDYTPEYERVTTTGRTRLAGLLAREDTRIAEADTWVPLTPLPRWLGGGEERTEEREEVSLTPPSDVPGWLGAGNDGRVNRREGRQGWGRGGGGTRWEPY